VFMARVAARSFAGP